MNPAERYALLCDLPGDKAAEHLEGISAAELRELLAWVEAKGETGRIWTMTALEVLRRFAAGLLN